MNNEISCKRLVMENGDERFVPTHVYERIEQEVKYFRENTNSLPKPIKWIMSKAIKNVDPQDHAEIAIKGLIRSVEELGGKINWTQEGEIAKHEEAKS